ncbi:hypothetical protein CRUP_001834 [Coryphaenoides rupestris]|nr:hypothetical protein CRUP_001834 [Coryphaenoides rupestris]
MARKKSKQPGGVAAAAATSTQKEPPVPGNQQQQQAPSKKPPMHTCCLLCHREFKDWGASSANGLPGGHGTKLADAMPALSQALLHEVPGRKLADAVPSLSQSLLGEVPLWICQSCRKSVEEVEMRSSQEPPTPVPLSHSSSCKSQSCGNGYPEQSSVDWDPSSFLSAHKLSGLWNSVHTNGGIHCNHNASSHSQQGVTGGSTCHDKRGLHEAPGKSAKTSAPKNSSGSSSLGNPLSTSADHCKTTPKHFKTMCRRPTPPGEAFHPGDHHHHHQHSDLSVPPNSPTGLSSQHSSLVPPKQSSGQHGHVSSSSSNPGTAVAHAPFSALVPNLHSPAAAKLASSSSTTTSSSSGPDSPTSVHKPSPCKNPHIPGVNAQHGKLGTSLMGCNHSCNGHNGGTVAPPSVGHLPTGACRDQACKSHKMANGTLCHPPSELDEGEDEDSSSERSSCASSSTNQKDGKYCDCCYCEFFAAPTSRNYAEIREKLRSRLTRRKEEPPQRQDSDLTVPSAIDNRDVDELLDFINSSEPKPVNSAKAAKRARHKQKKKAASGDPQSSPSEPADETLPDGPEANRLLDWPQLELERVNSFLTSRLEEIKNTIKDSIRASFSMYDLNLDVNDFPKKAATLEGNHLLSHLNGSTDMQQIDLDLAPLSLGTFKNQLDLVNGWEDAGTVSSSTSTADGATGQKDVQRLRTTPNLSKLSRIHSPERAAAAAPAAATASESSSHGLPQATAKSKEDSSEAKNTSVAAASKSKKNNKKQQQQRQEPATSEQSSIKPAKAHLPGNDAQKTNDSRVAEMSSGSGGGGSKPGGRQQQQQPQQLADSQRNGPRKAEEGRPSRQAAANGASGGGLPQAQRGGKGDAPAEVRSGGRSEQDSDGRSHPNTNGQQQQQSKGKNKKSKNKGDKSGSAIDDVFLPKDVDPTEMDEIDREVEYFKRFCLDSAKQNRQKVAVNWSNFTLKKFHSNAAQ